MNVILKIIIIIDKTANKEKDDLGESRGGLQQI